MLIEFQGLPDPGQPLLAVCFAQVSYLLCRDRPRKDQSILSPSCRDVQQAHAFKFFAPAKALAQIIKQRAANGLAAAIRNADGQTSMAIKDVPAFADVQLALQIRNDHDREFQPLCLMDRHQPHDVGRLIHLAFAFSPAKAFKLFDVLHKIANQLA